MNTTTMLTPHFRLCEFLHNGSDEGVTLEVIDNLRALSKLLEGVREIIGKPLIISSGFRTVAHNAEVGGAPKSQHLYGKAADIVVAGLTPNQVYDAVKDHWVGGIGLYPRNEHRAGWIHLDTGDKRFWEG